MSERTWKKILNELKEWAEEGYRGTVCFHGAGEPLLHPNLRDRKADRVEGKEKQRQTHYTLSVRYPKVPETEIEAYLRKWIGISETISIARFRPIGSRRILSIFQRIRLKRKPCPMPYKQMVIAWDGRVGLCCEDIFLEECMGNVASNSVNYSSLTEGACR